MSDSRSGGAIGLVAIVALLAIVAIVWLVLPGGPAPTETTVDVEIDVDEAVEAIVPE